MGPIEGTCALCCPPLGLFPCLGGGGVLFDARATECMPINCAHIQQQKSGLTGP